MVDRRLILACVGVVAGLLVLGYLTWCVAQSPTGQRAQPEPPAAPTPAPAPAPAPAPTPAPTPAPDGAPGQAPAAAPAPQAVPPSMIGACHITLALRPGITAADDLLHQCSNDSTMPQTITAFACKVEGQGIVRLQPVLSGRGPTSIVAAPVVCTSQDWIAGDIHGTPIIEPFMANGATCPTPPCTVDFQIVSVSQQPRMVLWKLVYTY